MSTLRTRRTTVHHPPALHTVSVVIPTRNRGSLIEETIRSLLAMSHRDFELIVVDQSTNERTREAVEAVAGSDPRVRVCRSMTVGSSAARNVGASESQGDVVAYTDDDCIVAPGWLNGILEEFVEPRVAAVFGRLLPFESGPRTGREVGFKAAMQRAEFDRPTPPWYIGHGGNMAFLRSVLLDLGGFDPLLGAGGVFGAWEDPDVALRLLRAGRRIVYAPDALAYHKHWKDWPAQRRMERAYGIAAGAEFAKYMRCGDVYGARLLATWVWQMGVRRLGAGLLKWRSLKTMYLGYCQLVYPWIGVVRSARYRVDRAKAIYLEPDGS